MTGARLEAIEVLLRDTEAAHGVYETAELGGVYDEAWPAWYAQYAVEHGMGELIGRPVTSGELAAFLSATWDDISRLDPKPDGHWTMLIARRIAEDL